MTRVIWSGVQQWKPLLDVENWGRCMLQRWSLVLVLGGFWDGTITYRWKEINTQDAKSWECKYIYPPILATSKLPPKALLKMIFLFTRSGYVSSLEGSRLNTFILHRNGQNWPGVVCLILRVVEQTSSPRVANGQPQKKICRAPVVRCVDLLVVLMPKHVQLPFKPWQRWENVEPVSKRRFGSLETVGLPYLEDHPN